MLRLLLCPGLLLGRPDGPNVSGVTGTWGRSGLCLSASPLTSVAPQTGTLSAPKADGCSQEQELCSLLPPREPPSAPGRCSFSSGRRSQRSPPLLLSLQNLLQPPGVRTPSVEPSPVRRPETSGVSLPQRSCESRPDSGYGRLLRPACLLSAAPRPSIPTPPRSDRCSSTLYPGSRLQPVTDILFFFVVAARQEVTGSLKGRCQTPPRRPQVC